MDNYNYSTIFFTFFETIRKRLVENHFLFDDHKNKDPVDNHLDNFVSRFLL